MVFFGAAAAAALVDMLSVADTEPDSWPLPASQMNGGSAPVSAPPGGAYWPCTDRGDRSGAELKRGMLRRGDV
eukprot:scaffold21423_cov66-Phaeocystis_antarctica.AAC.4